MSATIVLTGARKGHSEFREPLLPQAHFLERHWVHPTLPWGDGTRFLEDHFGRDGPWSVVVDIELIYQTHGVGCIPPGNGPFYVPDWVLGDPAIDRDVDEAGAKGVRALLKRSGFRDIAAQVITVFESTDFLADAMRAASNYLWNVDPILYRCYLYPMLGQRQKRSLRSYTTLRWTPSGMVPVGSY